MVLSAIFLGHRLRLFKILTALILCAGVILVVRPPFLFPEDMPWKLFQVSDLITVWKFKNFS